MLLLKKKQDSPSASYNEDSTSLSKELESIGYTDIYREKNKELIITNDECSNTLEIARNKGIVGSPRLYISVGSQIECTALSDSDVDMLFGPSAEHVAAIRSPSDKKAGRVNILIVSDEESPPGHAWLQLIGQEPTIHSKHDMLRSEKCQRTRIQVELYGECIYSEKGPDVDRHLLCTWPGTLFMDDRDLKFYIPNSHFTLKGKLMWASKASRTGPSFSSNDNDFVRPIFCDNIYPRDQNPLTIGGKLYGNLHVPKEYPCNLVPVGHPESEDVMLEWRISYNLTEREIMFGFNITHIQTYVVLKMLQRHFFKCILGYSFTSFHCKTALFHAVATTEPAFWIAKNLIMCVRQCLKVIRIFTKKRFCPHFFNKSFNLFSGKFTRCEKHWDKLIDLIDRLSENTNLYFLSVNVEQNNKLEIENLSIGAQNIVLKCIVLVEQVNRNVLYCFLDNCFLSGLSLVVKPDAIRRMRVKYKTLMGRVKQLVDESETAHKRICAEIVHSFVKVRHYLLSAAYLLEQGKDLNPLVLENILPDALSMELQMSSLMFACGRYEMARTFMERVFVKTVSDPILFVKRQDYIKILSRYDYLEFINRYDGPYPITETPEWTFTKRHVALGVMFHLHELCLLHPLLRFEAYRFLFEDRSNMCRVDDEWACIACFDSIPFMFFMQYLVYKELGLKDQKYEALVRLEVCIDYSSVSSQHVAMNMFGICCELEWNYNKAVRYYARSLRTQPRFNAAKFHIALIVWRLRVKHNVES